MPAPDAGDQQSTAPAADRDAARTARTPDDPGTSAVDEHAAGVTPTAAGYQATRDHALHRAGTAAELALRWQSPVGAVSPPTTLATTTAPVTRAAPAPRGARR